VEALNIDDKPAAKSKGLDVLKEFEKSGQKKAANFVVIGMILRAQMWIRDSILTITRSRRCRQIYPYGSFAV
jgi:hypothetical protein